MAFGVMDNLFDDEIVILTDAMKAIVSVKSKSTGKPYSYTAKEYLYSRFPEVYINYNAHDQREERSQTTLDALLKQMRNAYDSDWQEASGSEKFGKAMHDLMEVIFGNDIYLIHLFDDVQAYLSKYHPDKINKDKLPSKLPLSFGGLTDLNPPISYVRDLYPLLVHEVIRTCRFPEFYELVKKYRAKKEEKRIREVAQSSLYDTIERKKLYTPGPADPNKLRPGEEKNISLTEDGEVLPPIYPSPEFSTDPYFESYFDSSEKIQRKRKKKEDLRQGRIQFPEE
ncbi:MAG: hypothetical protein LBD11_03550 [Candidatus Peribacteria bacterium]|jgi:hypothetical protein|nr:hypothetical protein [Candidatus Peribacteria bacterium]